MPAVGLDCLAHRGQPQTGSTWFSGEECIEDAREAVITSKVSATQWHSLIHQRREIGAG